jgi:hypothetical protein
MLDFEKINKSKTFSEKAKQVLLISNEIRHRLDWLTNSKTPTKDEPNAEVYIKFNATKTWSEIIYILAEHELHDFIRLSCAKRKGSYELTGYIPDSKGKTVNRQIARALKKIKASKIQRKAA